MESEQLRELYQSVRPDPVEPDDARFVSFDGRGGISIQRAWTSQMVAAIRSAGAPTVRFLAGTIGVGVSTALAELGHRLRDELPVRRVSVDVREARSADDLDRMIAEALTGSRGTALQGLSAADSLRAACAVVEGGLLLVDRRDQDVFAPPAAPSPVLMSWVERRIVDPLNLHLVAALPIEVAPWASPRLPLCVLPALPVVGVDGSLRHASFSVMRQILTQRAPERLIHEVLSPTEMLRVLEASAGTPGEMFDLVRGVVAQHAWQPIGAVERTVRRRQQMLTRLVSGPGARVVQRLRAGDGLDLASPDLAPVVAGLLRAGAVQAVADRDITWSVHPLVGEA